MKEPLGGWITSKESRTPEAAFFAKSNWPELTEAEKKLHATLIPEHRKRATDPKGFSDLYGGPTVTRDLKELQAVESSIAEHETPEDTDRRIRGELFEAMLTDQIESSDWLGEEARTIVPSRYDDVMRGIDLIIEFEGESTKTRLPTKTHLAIGVDITKGTESMSGKFALIKGSIREGKLSSAKYFKTEDYRGELLMVPRVIAGAGQKITAEVAELLFEFKHLQKQLMSAPEKRAGLAGQQENIAEFKRVREALANHRIQFMILFEMKMQLSAFRHYAERIGEGVIAAAYKKRLDIVEVILRDKMKDVNQAELEKEMEHDGVYRTIKERTASFLK